MKTIEYYILFTVAGTLGVMAQKPVPYLQTPTSTSIWVNWRTESSLDTKVYYGLAEDNQRLPVTANRPLRKSLFPMQAVARPKR
jgi:hypothetical protein